MRFYIQFFHIRVFACIFNLIFPKACPNITGNYQFIEDRGSNWTRSGWIAFRQTTGCTVHAPGHYFTLTLTGLTAVRSSDDAVGTLEVSGFDDDFGEIWKITFYDRIFTKHG